MTVNGQMSESCIGSLMGWVTSSEKGVKDGQNQVQAEWREAQF